MARFSNGEIQRMIEAPKPLPTGFWSKLSLKDKRGHREQQIRLKGDDSRTYHLMLRQSRINVLDFSIILAVEPEESNQWFRLRRYNGKSHEHTNRIEGQRFYDFHIHKATERYQDLGMREDGFAEPTRRYGDLLGALQCLIGDCGFYRTERTGDIFEGMDT